ncbi:MAG TPA: pyridoxamine 5'-phosphate oxidase [Jatrophihabitantaceae bacterium]|nr:pyridoxamine 5'-phosphate oxidase [Jatrophihabitantaceae bacterium]
MSDPAAMRREYLRGQLDESTVPATWLPLFQLWFDDATALLPAAEVNAMQVATVNADGRPSVRTVLLKAFDKRGVVFFTNYDSAKGSDLAARPYAAAVLAWVPLERQVRISGPAERIDRAETEAYFATRPRGAQLGAWASPQSQVVASRAELDRAARDIADRFAGQDVPPPEHWGGIRIVPETVEFWQGRPDRLHDRMRYRADESAVSGWTLERLAP